ncbi:hypothetical protein GE21DRAFT_7734 [Neurospora crassa]|uniref:Uncharacterized protein n=2 Tax=Neurospora crassa TaxID=5141 RepID=Q1K7V9_NEUCR|nr:hypothetical protein NCU01307 [Neurospora crassa OR74A]EAA32157.2 hypothetical protein NCU01307 [Neurospora crassa OR74A]KHE83506.1 hypothetical protein GE21DRAFT_7734 [Neurospora crassa]|eukprot:XP_961393.2 hypothetical protein NCU01307 [Neurospora crassa OR74A]
MHARSSLASVPRTARTFATRRRRGSKKKKSPVRFAPNNLSLPIFIEPARDSVPSETALTMASQPPTETPAPAPAATTPETPEIIPSAENHYGTPNLLHNSAIIVSILAPIGLLLPGRGRGQFSVQNAILGSGTFWGFNQLSFDYTGKSIYQRSNEKWAKVLSTGDALPEQAKKNKALIEAERARRKLAQEQQDRKDKHEKDGGVLTKIWMGDEKEGWKEKRLEEEKKALESGKGYGSLIMDQIWEVWNQEGKGKKKDEKGKDGDDTPKKE